VLAVTVALHPSAFIVITSDGTLLATLPSDSALAGHSDAPESMSVAVPVRVKACPTVTTAGALMVTLTPTEGCVGLPAAAGDEAATTIAAGSRLKTAFRVLVTIGAKSLGV
jgi:hypothetical protein